MSGDGNAIATAQPPATSPLLAAFLVHLQQERRLSPHTVEGYRRDVVELLALAADEDLRDVQVHQVRRFVAKLHARGLGGKSLARLLSAWRGFFEFLARDHGFTRNPCVGVRPPKSPRSLPSALSPDEASRLVDIAGD